MRYINSLPRPLLFKKGNGSAGRFLRKVHLIYVVFFFSVCTFLCAAARRISLPFRSPQAPSAASERKTAQKKVSKNEKKAVCQKAAFFSKIRS